MFENKNYSAFLQWERIPDLKDPVMVVGFHGWSDAGNVSSDTLVYLNDTQQPQNLASLSEEPFINYALDRPLAEIQEGVVRQVEPMEAKIKYWVNPEPNHDLILFLGKEPHYRWLVYSSLLVDVMRRLRVTQLFTIGGVQDTISHSASPVMSIVGSSDSAIEEIINLDAGIQLANYEGPISIHTCILQACSDEGISAVSLWGHVPAYLQKNPRQVSRMVNILNRSVGMECPVEVLTRKSIELDRRIDEALAKDPNLRQFVESIEGRDESLSRSKGEDNIIRLNDFLRRDSNKDPQS
jgi:proteasome assembly chaperone (PAC2) family protein